MSAAPRDTAPTAPLRPEDPERIAGYTLLGRLGSGGMGTVFLARSAGGRVVALKTVHEHLAREPEFRIRFRLEAEAARTIGERHGATVVAADTQGALPWLATEYLLGPSLAEAVAHHGPLPEAVVRALGTRLARALADIHASGLVHRDLKPSNVLVTAAGPRVIDFGIARALGARRLTRTGQAVGTPAYMSPEQASGRDHEPPGDVFALAGVLVFAATGHGAFDGKTPADVLYEVRYGTPDLSGVPAGLLPVLSRCLAKDPAERPAPEALATELGGAEGGFADLLPGPLRADLGRRAVGVWELRPSRLPGPPPPADPPSPTGWTSRRRLLLAGTGGLLALGSGGAVWAARGRSGPPPAARKPASPSPRPPGLPPEPLWTYDAGSPCRVEAVRDGIVVVSIGDGLSDRTLAGLDAATGRQVWRSPGTVSVEETGEGLVVREKSMGLDAQNPLLALTAATGRLAAYPGELRDPRLGGPRLVARTDDRLYLSGYDGDRQLIAAYTTADGRRLWAQGTGHEPYAPNPGAVAAGDVLVYSVSGDVVGLGRDDGRERWRTDFYGPSNLPLEPVHPASLDGGRLFLGGGEVRALETATGKVLWRFGVDRIPYPGGRAAFGIPKAVDGMVYVLGLTPAEPKSPVREELLALRASDGALQWSYGIPENARFDPPPILHGGRLYVDTGRLAQPLLAVDLATRRPPWTYRSGFTEDGHPSLTTDGYTELRIAGDRLHLSCGTHVIALPANG